MSAARKAGGARRDAREEAKDAHARVGRALPRRGRSAPARKRTPPERPEPEVVLAIDIGNTQTVLGIFQGEDLALFRRVSSGIARTGDELSVLVSALCRGYHEQIQRSGRIILGSVVPALTQEYEAMCARLYGQRPLVLSSRVKTGVRIDLPDPSSLGADRIANAAAVADGPLPAIVVDLGTATTFDVIRPGRRYIGGAIAPGIRTSADELFHRAARLPKVEIRKPPQPIGRTTEESIQVGVYYGAIGTIDGIVRRLEKELKRPARVVATGGLARLISGGSETIQAVDEALTLRGLKKILSLNR
ncbi:MAG: type III pantothenate kinase [Candidatus Eisenbacteria bacterium]|nr:type III pantothenate kinase [Candidatus Eisenbacteria bacterium]